MTSAKGNAANQRNAEISKGPRTDEGKRCSSFDISLSRQPLCGILIALFLLLVGCNKMTDTKSFGIKRFEFEAETQISKRGVSSEGLSAVMFDTGKWGYIDKTGKIVIQPQFSYVEAFSDGLAAVKIHDNDDEKWGYIDKTGKIVIQPQFSQAGTFSEGLATVLIENGTKKNYVMIDKTGKIVIGK